MRGNAREVIILLASLFSLLTFLWLADFNAWAVAGAFATIVGAVGLAVYVSRKINVG